METKSWVPRMRSDENSDWNTSPYRFATKSEANKEAHWAAARMHAEYTDVIASQEAPNAKYSPKHGAVPIDATMTA